MGTKPSQSGSMGAKPSPTEIVAKFSWTKKEQYFPTDVSLFLGGEYSSAIHPREEKRG